MRIFLLALAALMFTNPVWAKCDAGEREIKMGSWFDANAFARSRAAGLLRTTINRELQGKVCMTLTGSSETLSGVQGLAALRAANVQMLAVGFETMATLAPDYGAFQMPFGFRNLAAVERFQQARSASLFTALEQQQLRPLSFLHEGFDHLASRLPTYAPADLAGKRLWGGQDGSVVPFAAPLRAVAHTASENQLELAIKQKRVDVVIEPWTGLNATGAARLLGHGLESQVRFHGYQLVTAQPFWDGLDAAVQRDLLGLIRRITVQVNFETSNRNRAAQRTLMRAGVKMGTLTRTQRELLRNALSGLRQQSPELKAAVEAANAGL